MAAALSLTMGRLGALVGNLVFGYLIDLACVVPIVLFAAFLFGKKFFPSPEEFVQALALILIIID